MNSHDVIRRPLITEKSTLGRELPGTRYRDAKGRRKRVRYWEMQVRGGAFVANEEVDSVRWLSVEAAAELLSYPRDAKVLRALAESALARPED